MKIPGGLVAGALALAAACAAAQGVKIGYVNASRIENESAPARRAMEALKKEFAPREKQILDLQKRIEADRGRFDRERDKLPPAELKARGGAIAEMMRQSDQMALSLADDIELRKNEMRARLVGEANIAIKAVAEAGKYDLILQDATYARPGIDITGQVLKEMARRAETKPGPGK